MNFGSTKYVNLFYLNYSRLLNEKSNNSKFGLKSLDQKETHNLHGKLQLYILVGLETNQMFLLFQ